MNKKARFGLLLVGLAFGVLLAACGSSFTVNSAADDHDANLNDGKCETANAVCTLRAAIEQANKDKNGATITFDPSVTLITPAMPLPPLTGGGIRIQGEGAVTLDGNSCAIYQGLIIQSSFNKIQGLTITGFNAGIVINGGNTGAVTNIIGDDPTKTEDAAKVRNVISGNCVNGVYIQGQNANGNTVAGNYIGTSASGSTANPNGNFGIVLINGTHDNVIGGLPVAGPDISPQDQISYWTLDEASGNRADSVGANTLVETSGTIAALMAKVNDGADFELADSEFFEVADNPALSTGDIDFTLAGWVKLESEGTYQDLVSKYDAGNKAEYSLYYNKGQDRFVFEIYNAAGQKVGSVNNGTAVTPGIWYYIVVWHDSVNDVVGMQVNNGAANTGATTGTPTDTTANFRMGADTAAETTFLDGMMDEWGFWKRLLTQQEKDKLYNNGNGYISTLVGQGSNVISGNVLGGIWIDNATQNIITGNYIGVTQDGKNPLPNGAGILMSKGSNSNIIGIDAAWSDSAPNVISANANDGIYIDNSR